MTSHQYSEGDLFQNIEYGYKSKIVDCIHSMGNYPMYEITSIESGTGTLAITEMELIDRYENIPRYTVIKDI